MDSSPKFKEIVLVGGGHSHALLIHRWGMDAVPGVRLTLVSLEPQTPYSGMLPGLIAGHYDFDQTHIDLSKLCHWAGVRFVQARVTGLNPEKKTVQLLDRPELYYDVLSIDIGSVPNQSIKGVVRYATSIKPIGGFFRQWQNILQGFRLQKTRHEVAIVGGGAGAVETILAMAWAIKNDPNIVAEVKFKLVYRGSNILPGYTVKVLKSAENACKRLGVSLHGNFTVKRVEAKKLTSEQDETELFDTLFWCTEASAPSWLNLDGLKCNEDGFIIVNEHLQSVNYPDVFAAGDIAHMLANPRPKAGVYAVRQAPFLFENVCNHILGKAMRTYLPQDNFLSLLALGGKTAVGERKPVAFNGDWVWRWKDRIDRKFMDQFSQNSANTMQGESLLIDSSIVPVEEKNEQLQSKLRCQGCGAKIGAGVLSQVLTELTGSYNPEDASVIDWPQGSLVQSIDQITSPIDDPFLFGRIAVFHATNDLHAMNAQPHSLQLGVTLPFAGRDIQIRELRLILQGVLSACKEEKVTLLGGHSAEGSNLTLSLTLNGTARDQTFGKQRLEKGDLLVLNKPIGTGVMLAARMQGLSRGKDLSTTLDWMNHSNKKAAFVLKQLNVQCCTDVSGFGFLGHLSEMLADTDLEAELYVDKIPYLPGVIELVKQGVRSSLFLQNEAAVIEHGRWAGLQNSELWPLLLDPQTSGGLLASIREEHANSLEEGFVVVGRVK